MRVEINRNDSTPVYVQIANQIRGQILAGTLPDGFVLPSERKFAEAHRLSRSTVVSAYEELKALGLVNAQIGRGTVVTGQRFPDAVGDKSPVFPMSWYGLFDKRIADVNDTVSEMMAAGSRNDMISLAAGIGDPRFYPVAALRDVRRDEPISSAHLNFSPVEGYYPLRESVCQLMAGRGLTVTPRETMIVAGSMQGIDYTARAFLSPGDAVVVEEPTFLQAIQCFRASGARIIGIPMDREGLRIDVLKAQLARYKPKFIYTIPNFHNPTGTTMSVRRRIGLLQLAYRYQIPILEDDPYGDILFSGEQLPPIKALDNYGYVIYLSTFSKALFPGFRMGWLTAPEPVLRKFMLLKQITDLHVNTDSQMQIDHYLRGGQYEAHLRRILPVYRQKRDLAVAKLKNEAPHIDFECPQGGFYLWCRLPYRVPQKKLLALCAGQGVLYAPGNVFFPQPSDGEHWLRLNYTYETPERLAAGLAILIKAIKKLGGQGGSDTEPTGVQPLV
ncbi:MAG: PLP-dependent aminotransferase family protein [Sporolactobacillus sp.]